MHLEYNDMNYPCKCRPSATMVYRGLPDDFPTPVEGEIKLCSDDGFVMRTDNTADYLRQTFENGTLTLTNVPEPVEEEEPEYTETPKPTLKQRVTELETQLAESDAVAMALYEASVEQDAVNAEQDEAILGLYELIGG